MFLLFISSRILSKKQSYVSAAGFHTSFVTCFVQKLYVGTHSELLPRQARPARGFIFTVTDKENKLQVQFPARN